MVQFNPFHRPTAKDLLKDTYFDSVRDDKAEADAPFKIMLTCDQPNSEIKNDYENEGVSDPAKTCHFI